jgi:putative hydrolase of the HAD superfamily
MAEGPSDRVVLWDFDGTLAHRPGMWRGCMVEVLDEHEPGHGISDDVFVPFLRDGFPWHAPDVAHPELCEADAWWRHVEPPLVRGYEGAGLAPERALALARLVRERYVDVSRWRLFDDTLPVLRRLRERGWRHVILSNHVPELGAIVAALGLDELVDETINSALTGYEKPNAEAFELGRRAAGGAAEIWMVGDNPVADVAGAEAAGIPAILVRTDPASSPEVERAARTLDEVEALLDRRRDERMRP